jgi:thiamine-phosphate pyrophosphorylase
LLLYYITDRAQFTGTESQRRERLLKKIADAALAGVDYVQVREKDLSARELESLLRDAAEVVRESGSATRLLINSRTDVALAVGADGVHLNSNDISSVDVRNIWSEARASESIVAISCHTESDVIAAENASDRVGANVHVRPASADFVVFGPVFEKGGATETAAGIAQLQKVCRHRIPVLALGGVTTENAHLCIEAGASGIAGIRLFQENDVATVVTKLRGLK